MTEPKNFSTALSGILMNMHSAFKGQQHQKHLLIKEFLGDDMLMNVQEVIAALLHGDTSALAAISDIKKLPSQILAREVAVTYPDLSVEQHQDVVTFLLNIQRCERAASHWFNKIEGHACSSDKGRALVRMIWRYVTKGIEPSPNYTQQYTYQLSKGSLTSAKEILEWYHGFLALQRGDITTYALLMKHGFDRYNWRQHETDLSPERTPPLNSQLCGAVPFVIRASLALHAPEFNQAEYRILILSYGGDFSEINPLFHHRAKSSFTNALIHWALTNETLNIPPSIRKFFATPDDVFQFLQARLDAMQGRREQYKAILERLFEIKKTKVNV